MKEYAILLCKKCLGWESVEAEKELTGLLEITDYDLEYEEGNEDTLVKKGMLFWNNENPKKNDSILNIILQTTPQNDFITSPKSLQNVRVEGAYGCCGFVGDATGDTILNVFCCNNHPIGMETSDCLVPVQYTRIAQDKVEIIKFTEEEVLRETK